LIETGATQEQFLLVANRGLESPDKKYYERLIATENYLYFKSMMLKRNLHLEEEAMKLMISKGAEENVDVTSQSNLEFRNLYRLCFIKILSVIIIGN